MLTREQAWAWYLERNPSQQVPASDLLGEQWPPHLAVCEFYLDNERPHTRRCRDCWCHLPAQPVIAEGR